MVQFAVLFRYRKNLSLNSAGGIAAQSLSFADIDVGHQLGHDFICLCAGPVEPVSAGCAESDLCDRCSIYAQCLCKCSCIALVIRKFDNRNNAYLRNSFIKSVHFVVLL